MPLIPGFVSTNPSTGAESGSGAAKLVYDALKLHAPPAADGDPAMLAFRIAARQSLADLAEDVGATLIQYVVDNPEAGFDYIEDTITHADLANGAVELVSSSEQLPAGAQVMGVDIKLTTAFTGGGSTVGLLDVGHAIDPQAFIAAADVGGVPIGSAPQTTPLGRAPHKRFTSATNATYQFTTDVTTAAWTAGSVTIRTIYVVWP